MSNLGPGLSRGCGFKEALRKTRASQADARALAEIRFVTASRVALFLVGLRHSNHGARATKDRIKHENHVQDWRLCAAHYVGLACEAKAAAAGAWVLRVEVALDLGSLAAGARTLDGLCA